MVSPVIASSVSPRSSYSSPDALSSCDSSDDLHSRSPDAFFPDALSLCTSPDASQWALRTISTTPTTSISVACNEELAAPYGFQMEDIAACEPLASALASQVNSLYSRCGVCTGITISAEDGALRVDFRNIGNGKYFMHCSYFMHCAEQPTTTTTAPTQQPVAIQQEPTPPIATVEVAVKFNAGYGNSLFVRGNVPGMSWDRGTMLRNTGADSWVFAIPSNARNCEFKLVLNDTKFEKGRNRKVNNEGQIINGQRQVESPIIPKFPR